MTKMFIPSKGTKIIISKDWKLPIEIDYRSMSFVREWMIHETDDTDMHETYFKYGDSHTVIIPKDTVLRFKKIEINKPLTSDHITFEIFTSPLEHFNPKKIDGVEIYTTFWAKVEYVNEIFYELV